jgi:16S rRNA (guanine1207-N2)-methyltransferase
MAKPEHYFSAVPAGDPVFRTLSVSLAGRLIDVTTANGTFSPDRIDVGTSVLLTHVPAPPPAGNLLDLGCGWGPVALSLAIESPRATVWAVDVNARALDLVRRNAADLGLSNVTACCPEEVPTSVRFTTIWSNPPIRVGKNELHNMLSHWLPRLEPGADAWLVVQRNLGSDSLHRWLNAEFPKEFVFLRAATNKGYRVLRCRRCTGLTAPIDVIRP